MGEALINKELDNIQAYSCGVVPSGAVNPNAKKVLLGHGAWQDSYYSKDISEVSTIEFNLIVTVCDHAKETCPVFPYPVPKIHVGFEDPDGKPYETFEETYRLIRDRLLPIVERELSQGVTHGEKKDSL